MKIEYLWNSIYLVFVRLIKKAVTIIKMIVHLN